MDYTDIESLDNEIDAIQDDLDNFFSIKELNEYISEVKTECRSNHYADMLDLSDADREEILDSFLEKVDEIASERIKEILNRSNRKSVEKIKLNLPTKQGNILLSAAFRNITMFIINDKRYFENKENSREEFLEYFEDIFLDLFEEDKEVVLKEFNRAFDVIYISLEDFLG